MVYLSLAVIYLCSDRILWFRMDSIECLAFLFFFLRIIHDRCLWHIAYRVKFQLTNGVSRYYSIIHNGRYSKFLLSSCCAAATLLAHASAYKSSLKLKSVCVNDAPKRRDSDRISKKKAKSTSAKLKSAKMDVEACNVRVRIAENNAMCHESMLIWAKPSVVCELDKSDETKRPISNFNENPRELSEKWKPNSTNLFQKWSCYPTTAQPLVPCNSICVPLQPCLPTVLSIHSKIPFQVIQKQMRLLCGIFARNRKSIPKHSMISALSVQQLIISEPFCSMQMHQELRH